MLNDSKVPDDERTPINGRKRFEVFGETNILGFQFEHKLKYNNIFMISLFHLLVFYWMLTFPWLKKWKLVACCFTYGYISGFGITAGVHRYFSHKTYKATVPFKMFLLICYAAAGHNKLYDWVRDHRVHHKYSETDADPHNAKRGFFFAHVGWLMMNKHPKVIEKGNQIDMSDIKNDPILVWFDRHFVALKIFFCFLLPIGLCKYYFEESWYVSITINLIRYIILLNSTWLVNSAAHMFGNKPFDKRINPSDHAIVSFFSVGEGYHNYHHTFPWDYKTSELGVFNFTTFLIDFFAKFGLVYDLKTPSMSLVKEFALKHGDGSFKPIDK